MENSIPLLRRKMPGVSVLAITILFVLSTNIRAQVVAGFDIDDPEGCTPHTATFTNTSTSGTGDPMSYYWYFGDNTNSTATNPAKTYNSGANFTVSLVVTNTNNPSDRDSISKIVTVYETPAATLNLSKGYACVNEMIDFTFSGALKDSLRMDFGDGTQSTQLNSPITHKYKAHGTYNIKFYTYYKTCADINTSKSIIVDGPISEYTISKDSACIGEEITFSLGATQVGVDSTEWFFGDGTSSKENTITHAYDNFGDYLPTLQVYGIARDCPLAERLHIYNVDAEFSWENMALCAERFVYFKNNSSGNNDNLWNFGTGDTSVEPNPQYIFQMGTQIVSLTVSNKAGCSDYYADTFYVNDIPDIALGEDYWFVCQGQSVQLEATGGDSIVWIPSNYLDNPLSYTPVATPPATLNYQVYVYDTATKCPNYGVIRVEVQNLPDWNVSIDPMVDTVIVGETDTIFVNPNGNYVVNWDSEDTIVNFTKDYLVVKPLAARDEYAEYYITIADSNGCFDFQRTVSIYVRDEYSIGLPKAFSPNGDNINDEIKVNGWGIKSLIELRIYNRGGTQVFFTDDLNTGWDGTFNGKPQPIDSYAYVFKVEMWDDRIVEQKGTFTLIR